MAPRMGSDDTPTRVLDAAAEPTPWHERPSLLVAATIAGVLGLGALAFSVVSVSDHSTQPVPRPAPVVIAPAAPVTSAPPTMASALPSVPDFASGPTAETEVPPPPQFPPDGLPGWLRRLFPHWNAGSG